MQLSKGVLQAALETYIPSKNMSFDQYAQHLQGIVNKQRGERDLKKIQDFMRGRWGLDAPPVT